MPRSHSRAALLALSTLTTLTALAACARPPHAPATSAASIVLGTPGAAGWRALGEGTAFYAARTFHDFVLDLDWRADSATSDAGIVLRVPRLPNGPADTAGGGYEVRLAPDAPRQAPAGWSAGPWSGPSRERYARIAGAITG